MTRCKWQVVLFPTSNVKVGAEELSVMERLKVIGGRCLVIVDTEPELKTNPKRSG